ncbi:WD40-repeat-containing domain protein [Dissophora ornata]|nr:WD40-repeat-containing domain protein [Dissophora ornata]
MAKMLSNPPKETVSCMAFNTEWEWLLLVASWDKTVSAYMVDSTMRIGQTIGHKGAVLACCWGKSLNAFSAGVDGTIWKRNYALNWGVDSNPSELFGTHDDAIISLAYSKTHDFVVSGSSDRTVRVWDAGSDKRNPSKPLFTIKSQCGVDSLDVLGDRLVVAGEKEINVYDLRMLVTPYYFLKNEITLQKRPRVTKMMTQGEGCALASVEGRVEIRYFNDKSKNYSFKATRREAASGDSPPEISPVNAIAFNPKHGTLVTGSSNGSIMSWNQSAKVRLATLVSPATSQNNVAPVSALAFNHTGTHLAIATGDTFDNAAPPFALSPPASLPKTQIIIRPVLLAESSRQS